MKHITKNEPHFFSIYLYDHPPNTWEEVSRAIGHDVRVYMLSGMMPDGNELIPSEQNYQCAYTELDIEPEGRDSHIDHFRKQSMFQDLRFEWTNLFTACNHDDYGAKHKDQHIVPSDYDDLIHPAIDHPSQYLTYNLLGKVIEVSQDVQSDAYKQAKKTLDLLNLNAYSLKQQRLAVSKQVQAVYKQLSLDEIKENVGKFDRFVEFVYHAYKEMDEGELKQSHMLGY